MKVENPLVTIIIPVYNGENYVKYAIDSALNQTYKNIEILVINDGSIDDTEKICKRYGKKIRYISKENGGVATALNMGIKKAKGDYISWLSHDDLYKPFKVEKEIEIINRLKDKKTIIFSNAELINDKGEVFVTTNYANKIGVKKLCQGIFPVLKGCVNGCTTLINKKCFEEVGLFDENLRTTNDYEMWIRLFKKFESYLIEEPLIQYRIHENQDTQKSPFVISESNELWSNIINNITENEIKNWGVDPYSIYMDLYFQMFYSKFDKAAKLAYEKAKELYFKSYPVVSIIMPCFNSEKYLAKSIDSVLNQTYRNFELLIVNDSSTDNTTNIIKEYMENDFRIKYFENEYKKGISGAMNTGLKNSKGKYITRMDSDDTIVLEKLEKQVEFLENNPLYGVCSVNINMMDVNDNIYNNNVYHITDTPIEWEFLWLNPIPSAPAMYRSNIVKDNNITFNEKYNTAEDYDFLEKLIRITKFYIIDESLYNYRHLETSAFNTNYLETLENSYAICTNHFKSIVKEDEPDYYRFLTFFYSDHDVPVFKDVCEVYSFLIDISLKFNDYYNWNNEQYELVKNNIVRIIERFSVYKYVKSNTSSEEQLTVVNYSVDSNNKIISLLKKNVTYAKENGIKMTINKVVSKVKRKLCKRK